MISALCVYAPTYAQLLPKLYTPQPGDLVFFKADDTDRQKFYKQMTGSPITHVGIFAYNKKGVLKMYHAIGDKGNSTRSGSPTVAKKGVLAENPSYLETDPDTILIRQKWPPLNIKQSATLTAFLEGQVGKPYDEKNTLLLAADTPKISPVPPTPDQAYFCSKLVACAIADIVGPVYQITTDARGKRVPFIPPLQSKPSTFYIYPDGIFPGDFAGNFERTTAPPFDLDSKWKSPILIEFPTKKPEENKK